MRRSTLTWTTTLTLGEVLCAAAQIINQPTQHKALARWNQLPAVLIR